MTSTLRGILKMAFLLLSVLFLIPAFAISKLFGKRATRFVRRMQYAAGMRVAGLRVNVEGLPLESENRAVLFVSNHSSYLDIIVLGHLLNPAFIAKQEVKGWAVFGWLAQLSDTIFVRRDRKESGSGISAIEKRLKEGDRLVLFAEGTTSDGARVLPFKSTLLKVSENWHEQKPLMIQPVSITCTHINHLPAGTRWRQFYSWIGDESLVPHLWQATKTQSLTVNVTFHAPVQSTATQSRKALTRDLKRAVEEGINSAIRGKTLEEVPSLVL